MTTDKTKKTFVQNINIWPFLILTAFFSISLSAHPVSATQLHGTVIAVDGIDVTIEVKLIEPYSPAVGDMVDLIETADKGRVMFDIGDWKVTEVNGATVKAEAFNVTPETFPKVNMKAVIRLSPGPVGVPVAALGSQSSRASGKVIMLRGQDVTIQLDKGQPEAAEGDIVELSFSAGGEVIPVGTWCVSAVKGGGIVEAKPLDPKGKPNIGMDAQITLDPNRPKAKRSTLDSSTGEKSQKKIKKPPVDAAAIYKDALKYRNGDGVPKDEKRAFGLFKEAGEMGHASAQVFVGWMYEFGRGAKKDVVKAVSWYKKACSSGDALGCKNLGGMYETGKGVAYHKGLGVRQNDKKAAEFFEKGCQADNLITCNNLGWLYQSGSGVAQNYKKAAELYEKGCRGDHFLACKNLGALYENGWGVVQNYKKAAELYEKGCRGDHLVSCNSLALMYAQGSGVETNYGRALNLFQKSCDGNYAMGCGNLGIMYSRGWGVTKDSHRAAELYEKACNAGENLHCGNLGLLYAEGRGVTKDQRKAIGLLEKGCSTGKAVFCNKLNEIKH
jgi:TPR repeat protein